MRQTFEVVRSASETVATPGIPTPLPGLVITDDGHGEGVELVHVRSGLPIFGAKSAETIAKVIPLLAPFDWTQSGPDIRQDQDAVNLVYEIIARDDFYLTGYRYTSAADIA